MVARTTTHLRAAAHVSGVHGPAGGTVLLNLLELACFCVDRSPQFQETGTRPADLSVAYVAVMWI